MSASEPFTLTIENGTLALTNIYQPGSDKFVQYLPVNAGDQRQHWVSIPDAVPAHGVIIQSVVKINGQELVLDVKGQKPQKQQPVYVWPKKDANLGEVQLRNQRWEITPDGLVSKVVDGSNKPFVLTVKTDDHTAVIDHRDSVSSNHIVNSVSTSKSSAGLVRHFVSFLFKPTTPQERQAAIMAQYRDCITKCVHPKTGKPYIISQDAGFRSSPEGADKNMQQGYIVTFASNEDRDYFVGQPQSFDPYHDQFKKDVAYVLHLHYQNCCPEYSNYAHENTGCLGIFLDEYFPVD